MAHQIIDWASIDETNRAKLESEIPRLRRGKEEYGLLTETLNTILETKAVATQGGVEVPGLKLMLGQYHRAIYQGKKLQSQSWWKKIRNMRDWDDKRETFKIACKRVWDLANTSFAVAARAEKAASRGEYSNKVLISPVQLCSSAPIRRRISLEAVCEHGRRHNRLDDTAAVSTATNNEPAAQNAELSATSEKIDMCQAETVRQVADATAARIMELLVNRQTRVGLHINNHYQGCVVGASGRTAPTVNYGGKNNKGAIVNPFLSPAETDGNSIDGDRIYDSMDVD
ncbi:hypothetical protein EDB19DRAFT_1670984 [Suillus lakei]|nr:hypothetical protein EDB19DRAFT_1670984 [Suillus lakei]